MTTPAFKSTAIPTNFIWSRGRVEDFTIAQIRQMMAICTEIDKKYIKDLFWSHNNFVVTLAEAPTKDIVAFAIFEIDSTDTTLYIHVLCADCKRGRGGGQEILEYLKNLRDIQGVSLASMDNVILYYRKNGFRNVEKCLKGQDNKEDESITEAAELALKKYNELRNSQKDKYSFKMLEKQKEWTNFVAILESKMGADRDVGYPMSFCTVGQKPARRKKASKKRPLEPGKNKSAGTRRKVTKSFTEVLLSLFA